ncbi:MAG: AAA family ATPase [Pseudomonadota bacterium]
MNEYQMVKAMLLHMGQGLDKDAPLAKALKEWMLNNQRWLKLGIDKRTKGWSRLIAAAEEWRVPDVQTPYVIELANGISDILELDQANRTLLGYLVACDRLQHVSALANIASRNGGDLPAMLGVLSGADVQDALRFVRRSPVLRLGLIDFRSNHFGETEIRVRWTLERLLDRAPSLGSELKQALIGPTSETSLAMADFAEVEDAVHMAQLLAGAARDQAEGVNILIYGPPGTGKTELAKVLSAEAGLSLHAIGEVDEDGEEPERYDRVNAMVLAQRVLRGKRDSVLMFDEMEDFIGDARPGPGDWMSGRPGSKVFANRMLEGNAVPVIWITNAIGNVDDAIIRRMTYVRRLDYPSRKAGQRIARRICQDERVMLTEQTGALIDAAAETTTVMRNAARAARLTGDAQAMDRTATSLVKTLRRGALPHPKPLSVDMALYNSDPALAPLIDKMANQKLDDVSLMLSGPPGTGKTALAHHFARRMDKPLLERRASDLLSKWVGETEQNIAAVFAEARTRQGVLFLDEADSLLFDRGTARNNWEVGQVNEFLSWLDRHDQPVLSATNHASRLDPAMVRRFDFKIDLKPLDREGLDYAFRLFFGEEAPAEIAELRNLTPGDFAVVKKQMRFQEDATVRMIMAALRKESALKPEGGGKIGF